LWFSLELLFQTFFILRRIQRNVVINVKTSSRKYLLLFSDFNKTCVFETDFLINLKYQVSWESFQWGPICSTRTYRQTDRQTDGRTDGRTDMTKLIVSFRYFVNAPNKHQFSCVDCILDYLLWIMTFSVRKMWNYSMVIIMRHIFKILSFYPLHFSGYFKNRQAQSLKFLR
jgi:hypothetical protein